MRRASTLLLQLKHRGKETRSELLLGATVTDGGLGYRSVTQALHNHVETNAAAFESCGGPWASFFPQGTLRSSDKSLKSSVLGRDSQCNASQCNDSQCNTLSALPPGDATVNSNSLLHHSAIARSPPLETPFSSSVSLANPSATFPGAALKPPLQRSGFGIQQSVSTRKQWGQERHCSWCGQEGRGYSSGAINLAGGEHRYEDTVRRSADGCVNRHLQVVLTQVFGIQYLAAGLCEAVRVCEWVCADCSLQMRFESFGRSLSSTLSELRWHPSLWGVPA